MKNITHCGYVAILGRPNVGKSTLLNKILQKKISIVSAKPQTTRQQILGIKTVDNSQAIYIDTPGLHKIAKRALNRYMNRAAAAVIKDVDLIIFVIEALRWKDEDEWILNKLKQQASCPVICVVNKVDKVKNKAALLPFLQQLQEKFSFVDIVPISATKDADMKPLEQTIARYLPENEFIFPADQTTDKTEQFIAAEVIREKLIRILGQEVPYALTVTIEQFEFKEKILHIAALILVEKPGQKTIVIGAAGENLKHIGKQARLELEQQFNCKIFLKLWVKVKQSWSDDERALRNLGFE